MNIRNIALCVTATLLWVTTASAAFIIEPNGLASANYSAGTGAGTSTAAGSGTLAAIGLTSGAASVFGGEPYTYTYTPSSDSDNATFAAGTVLNSNASLNASGVAGGGAGLYNVYITYPESSNQSSMPAVYSIDVGGDGTVEASSSYDQNVIGTGANAGRGIGLWEFAGQVSVTDPTKPIKVKIDGSAPLGFVGVRTAGVMFEAVPVPEPSSLLLVLGGLLASVARWCRR